MNIERMHETLSKSLAGKIAFPEVVSAMIAEGVERYRADLVRLEETFYMPDGSTHMERLDFPPKEIAEDFSAAGIVSAIRDSQAGRCKYREFLDRAMNAGVADYITYLGGQKVIYFGRKGDFHVEEFPRGK